MTFFVFFIRATGSSAPRPTAISATGRTVTSTTASTAAVTRTSRTATQQPVKPLVTASAARKGGAPFIGLPFIKFILFMKKHCLICSFQ